jgi:hypothetical protein
VSAGVMEYAGMVMFPSLLYSVCMNTLENPWIHDQQVKCHNQGHAHLCTPLGLFMDILASFSKIEEK